MPANTLEMLGYAPDEGVFTIHIDDGGFSHASNVAAPLAVLTGAFRDSCEFAVLVSSDGGFRPAVEDVRGIRKRVEYIFFPGAVRSSALKLACNVARRARRSWVIAIDR